MHGPFVIPAKAGISLLPCKAAVEGREILTFVRMTVASVGTAVPS